MQVDIRNVGDKHVAAGKILRTAWCSVSDTGHAGTFRSSGTIAGILQHYALLRIHAQIRSGLQIDGRIRLGFRQIRTTDQTVKTVRDPQMIHDKVNEFVGTGAGNRRLDALLAQGIRFMDQVDNPLDGLHPFFCQQSLEDIVFRTHSLLRFRRKPLLFFRSS